MLAQARRLADEFGHIAIGAVAYIAAMEAEIRRLLTALAQRQAYINRNRSAR